MKDFVRRHGAIALVLASLAALYAWLDAFDDLGGMGGDGLIYLATARDYAPYWPPDALAAEYGAATQFPPVYAWLLMASGGASSLLAAHLATLVFLLCAFAALYAWLVTIGVGRVQAALGVALFAAMPGTWVQSFYLHPEGLYVALVLVTLTLVTRAERTARAGVWWAAAATAGLAVVTRTVGITLLPALGVALWRKRPQHWPGMLAAPLLPQALWSVAHQPPWGYGDTLASYYGEQSSLSDVIGTALGSIRPTIEGLGVNVVQTPRLSWLAAVAGVLALAVALWRFARLRPDAWYVAAYLGVMMIWPFPEEARRLAWVLVPILLGYCLWAGERALQRLPAVSGWPRTLLAHAPVLALALVVLPGFGLLVARAADPLAYLHPEYRHIPEWYDPALPKAQWLVEIRRATAGGFRDFAPLIPADECVFSTKPLMAGFFTGRIAYAVPPSRVDDAAFEREIALRGCRFFVLHRDTGKGYATPHYPLDRLGGRLELLAVRGIAVGPDNDRIVAALAVLKSPGAKP